MKSKGFDKKLGDLRREVVNAVSVEAKAMMKVINDNDIMFHKYDISCPTHKYTEDGNLISTIAGVCLNCNQEDVLFVIDKESIFGVVNCYDISLSNLIYILGEIESYNSSKYVFA